MKIFFVVYGGEKNLLSFFQQLKNWIYLSQRKKYPDLKVFRCYLKEINFRVD